MLRVCRRRHGPSLEVEARSCVTVEVLRRMRSSKVETGTRNDNTRKSHAIPCTIPFHITKLAPASVPTKRAGPRPRLPPIRYVIHALDKREVTGAMSPSLLQVVPPGVLDATAQLLRDRSDDFAGHPHHQGPRRNPHPLGKQSTGGRPDCPGRPRTRSGGCSPCRSGSHPRQCSHGGWPDGRPRPGLQSYRECLHQRGQRSRPAGWSWLPTRIGAMSPRTTAVYHTLDSAPRPTSPMTSADGAMNAVG